MTKNSSWKIVTSLTGIFILSSCSEKPASAPATPAPIIQTEPQEEKPAPAIRFDYDGLIDHTNKPFTNAKLKGKKTIGYFFYPKCPSVCPTAGKNIVAALKDMNTDIIPVFITAHEGYTPQQVDDWLNQMGAKKVNAIGLTGSKETLERIYKETRAIAALKQHSPHAYVNDENGNFLGIIQTQRGPEHLKQMLMEKLQSKPEAKPKLSL